MNFDISNQLINQKNTTFIIFIVCVRVVIFRITKIDWKSKNFWWRHNRLRWLRFNPNFVVPLDFELNFVIAKKILHFDHLGRPCNFTIEAYFQIFNRRKTDQNQRKSNIRGSFLAKTNMLNPIKQSVFWDRGLWKIHKTNYANHQ